MRGKHFLTMVSVAGLCTVSAIWLACSAALADPSPSSFFERGFANSPLDPHTGGSPGSERRGGGGHDPREKDTKFRKESGGPRTGKGASRESASLGGETEDGADADGRREARSDNGANSIFEEGKEIVSLGVIVNALNPAHAIPVLEDLARRTRELMLPAGPVILIGTYGAAAAIFKKINERDPTGLTTFELLTGVSFDMAVPEKYPVRSSPSWVIRTTAGEYVLDGVQNIDRYVTSRKRFYDPDAIVVGVEGAGNEFGDSVGASTTQPSQETPAADTKTGSNDGDTLFGDSNKQRGPLVEVPSSWE